MTPEEMLKKAASILESKAHDYTSGLTRYENFERSALVLKWFKSDLDKAFVSLITTKLARLASLLGRKEPKNESINDSFLDLINYCVLWSARRSNFNQAEVNTIDEPNQFMPSEEQKTFEKIGYGSQIQDSKSKEIGVLYLYIFSENYSEFKKFKNTYFRELKNVQYANPDDYNNLLSIARGQLAYFTPNFSNLSYQKKEEANNIVNMRQMLKVSLT